MEEAVVTALLLTGFCIPCVSSSGVYHFVKEKMSWNDAAKYCETEHIDLAQLEDEEKLSAVMNVPTGGYRDKAWIGLYENASRWVWMDGEINTYSRWEKGQPDNVNASEFCVSMSNDGFWNDFNCSEKKLSLCAADGTGSESTESAGYNVSNRKMTWEDAITYCENKGWTLAMFPDKETYEKLPDEKKSSEVWIGLSRPNMWLWSESGSGNRFDNWRQGQPDNQGGKQSCAAMLVEDGTWSDERCQEKLPFFCSGLYMLWKTEVKMKIQSSGNMEDPASSTDLQRQLRAAFAKQGVTDFKLTWTKLPVRQTQESTDDKRCSD